MRILITGGAGFIGSNAAQHFLSRGHQVVILDNLSRLGASRNLEWLRQLGHELPFFRADVRDPSQVAAVFREAGPFDVVLHLAAQVAVTTSVTDPREDFEVNSLGTFNLLEASRIANPQPMFLYASTNKVYGAMDDVEVVERNSRYEYKDLATGVSESRQLDFHSPYGCSKGAADQYVIDYSRIYGLRTVSFRQSCIYGPRQFGVEDQGWVAWFCIAAVTGQPITIYGDGKQVRDVLYVEDLLRVYDLAIEHITIASGKAYNVGGGPRHTLSLLELIAFLEKQLGRPLAHSFADWRPGDQRVYVSDVGRAHQELRWTPSISAEEGLTKLQRWIQQNSALFEPTGAKP